MKARWALAIPVAALTLAGCGGDLKGLAVQGNMTPLYIQTATTAVLTEADIPIQTAPVCTADTKTSYSCTGKTQSGEAISASVPDAPATATNATLVVKVGSKQLYNGPIDAILLKNAQGVS